MDSGSVSGLEGDGAEQEDDDVVDVLCVVQLEGELVDIDLLQICLHLCDM